ncbi:MAG: hypothetical protein WC637_05310 [Victivallales bacterium]
MINGISRRQPDALEKMCENDRMGNWQGAQNWVRDSDAPCISLGQAGAFDDAHIFAPCVAYENGIYSLWYCGSRGFVDDRVFRLGLATSTDGIHFTKHPSSPVLSFGEGNRSILTPTLLRNPEGSVCRELGKLRLWFSSCDFPSGNPRHTLHEASSSDGLTWSEPSGSQLENIYAPTVILDGKVYRMWYTDVERDPWCFRYAESSDGARWNVDPEPVIVLDQRWELGRLFYPTVIKDGSQFLMWYGGYSNSPGEEQKTSIGFAMSGDGRHWRKNPANPVFGPEPAHSWESHYTTSQSVLRLPDGSWRIWYASRPKPPFEHKYFAIGTARLKLTLT